MKIDEVISLYKFLSTCGWWGYIAVWFLLSLVLGTTLVWGKEKLHITVPLKDWALFGIISIVVLFMVIAFHIDATNRNEVLIKANCLKSEFVTYGYKVASITDIKSSDFHCKCDDYIIARILLDHPNEFIQVKTDDGDDGIRIIDEDALDAINKYNQSHVPFIKSSVLDFMDAKNKLLMSYKEIRDSVNSDFDDEWIEMMLSRYDSLFIPWKKIDGDTTYGGSHYVKKRITNANPLAAAK